MRKVCMVVIELYCIEDDRGDELIRYCSSRHWNITSQYMQIHTFFDARSLCSLAQINNFYSEAAQGL